ncbi:MAG: hypothetical protein GWN62_04365 [Aliifodinibius sp.]|nr:hypothetical protein [Fodinibius sp.]
MSIPLTIPVDARPIFTDNSYTTTFNAYSLGRYNFTLDPTAQNQTILEMNPNSVYILEGVEFSMDTGEIDMHQSKDPAQPSPKLRLTTLRENKEIYPGGIKLSNYLDDFEIILFTSSSQKGDLLRGSFEGVYRQRGNLVGQLQLTAFINLIIYEINSTMWNGRYFDIKTDLGERLDFRG